MPTMSSRKRALAVAALTLASLLCEFASAGRISHDNTAALSRLSSGVVAPGNGLIRHAFIADIDTETGVHRARCRLDVLDTSLRPQFLQANAAEAIAESSVRPCDESEAFVARDWAAHAGLDARTAGLPVIAGICLVQAAIGLVTGGATAPDVTRGLDRIESQDAAVVYGWVLALNALGAAVDARQIFPGIASRPGVWARIGLHLSGGSLGIACTAAGIATGVGLYYVIDRLQ